MQFESAIKELVLHLRSSENIINKRQKGEVIGGITREISPEVVLGGNLNALEFRKGILEVKFVKSWSGNKEMMDVDEGMFLQSSDQLRAFPDPQYARRCYPHSKEFGKG